MEKRKRWKWRWFAALAGIVLVVGGAAAMRQTGGRGGETSDETPVELSFFLRKRETTHIFETIVEGFNESQDEIVVRTVIVPNPDVELEMRALDGEFPDIVEMIGSSGESIRQYAEGGYLMPLDDTGVLCRIGEGYAEYLAMDGEVYILPLSVNFRGLFLNRGLLERRGCAVPESYEELHSLLEEIRADGEQAIIFPDKDVWTLHQGWDAVYTVEWGSRRDAYCMAAEGSMPLEENPGMVNSLEKFLELREFGQGRSWEVGYDEAISIFAEEKAYMFLQGNWAYSAIKKQNPDIDMVFIPFPADGGKDPDLYVKLDSSIAVSASCEHPEAATAFLEYLLSEDVMNYYTESTGAYSCIKGGNGNLSFAERFVEKLEKNEFVLETMTVPERVNNVRDQGLLKLIHGQDEAYGIREFLEELDGAIRMRKEEILDDLKWEQSA